VNQPPIRIAFDALILSTATPSGVEHAVARTLRGLLEHDEQNQYLVCQVRGEEAARTCPANPRARYHRVLPRRVAGRIGRIAWQQVAEPLFLRLHKADVLHAPAYVSPLVGVPCPVVLSVYDVLALKRPDLCKGANAAHYRLVMPRAARRAARVIVPTEYVRADVVRWLRVPEERVEVVLPPLRPAPADDAAQRQAAAARLGLPPRFVLFLGNIEPKKNLSALVRAFAALKRERRVEHKLVLAGRWAWKYDDVLRAISDERIGGEIVSLGYVPDDDVPALLRLADVFVFPSIEEGLGMPPLEAMACGAPVVASNAASLPEVLGEAAILVPPDDVRQLRIAVDKVLHNQFLRRTLSRLGLEHAARFDPADSARRLIAIYNQVARPSEVERERGV